MQNISVTVRFSVEEFKKIKKIADDNFDGDKSKAVSWIVNSINYAEFCRSMAKYHAQQTNHFVEILRMMEQENEKLSN